MGLSPTEWAAVSLSLQVALWAVALSLPFGILVGWLLARRSFRGKWIVETLVNLTLVLPPVVTGYVLLRILGREGVIGAWLEQTLGVRIAFTWWAAALASAALGFPLMVRAIRLAFQGVDHDSKKQPARWEPDLSTPSGRSACRWRARESSREPCWPSPAAWENSAPRSSSRATFRV